MIHTADTCYFIQSNTTNVSVSPSIFFPVYSDILCRLFDSFYVTSTKSKNCIHYKSTSEKTILKYPIMYKTFIPSYYKFYLLGGLVILFCIYYLQDKSDMPLPVSLAVYIGFSLRNKCHVSCL